MPTEQQEHRADLIAEAMRWARFDQTFGTSRGPQWVESLPVEDQQIILDWFNEMTEQLVDWATAFQEWAGQAVAVMGPAIDQFARAMGWELDQENA